jgi:hypothetical protein
VFNVPCEDATTSEAQIAAQFPADAGPATISAKTNSVIVKTIFFIFCYPLFEFTLN